MSDRTKARILVVDDNRVNRRILEARLGREGYEVVLAESGAEALKAVGLDSGDGAKDGNRVDLVLLDIMMPEIDGMQVLKTIREALPGIELPVIMATAKGESEDMVLALGEGANDYVTKPYDLPVLLARVETQLDLKRSHEALREAQRSLIQAAKMESVGFLAAGVAHEIRNPLAQVQMGVDGLRGMTDSEESESIIEIMEEAVKRADEIIKGLMRFSKSDSLELKPGDLDRIVEEASDTLKEEAAGVGVTIEVSLGGDLPEVMVARDEFLRVLINIMLNAVQAMPKGGKLNVRTAIRTVKSKAAGEGSRSGRHLREGDKCPAVIVEDEGTGIPEEDLGRIFDPFFSTKATGRGTGLGLTVAKKVVEVHGGLIAVENREDGKGARVIVGLRPATKTGML